MNVIISNSSEKPIYEQIYDQIKGAILRGEVKGGEMLPSIRALARELRISVITTKRAFDDLEKDGFICSVQGKGSFVAEKSDEIIREEHLKRAEEKICAGIEEARMTGLSDQEIKEMMLLLLKGE